MKIQNKIKITVLVVSIIFCGLQSVEAVTVTSSQVITDYKTMVTGRGFQVVNAISGNLCNTWVTGAYNLKYVVCPQSRQYAQSTILDGKIISSAFHYCTNGGNYIYSACGNLIYKKTVSNCTYTTSVKTWSACSLSGVQYATSYNYATVAGTSCTDRAVSSRSCTPPLPSCSITFNPSTLNIGTSGTMRLVVTNDVNNLASCRCTGLAAGNTTLGTGTYSQGPFTSPGTKNCTCTVSNAAGSRTCSASLTVPAPITYSCTGTTPTNATLCSGDSTGLTVNTTKAVVSSCTAGRKCEYTCNAGYYKNGAVCSPIVYSCTGTTPTNATLCSGDSTGLTTNTVRALVSVCTAAKCEYTCNAGYYKNGNICSPIIYHCTDVNGVPSTPEYGAIWCSPDTNTGLIGANKIWQNVTINGCTGAKCEYIKHSCSGDNPPYPANWCTSDEAGLTVATSWAYAPSGCTDTRKCEYTMPNFCGSRARSHAATDITYYSDQVFCKYGSLDGSDPAFPEKGESISWTCTEGPTTQTCTASRRKPITVTDVPDIEDDGDPGRMIETRP